MRKYNPYRNIFYYYRGPSSRKVGQVDKQIEDNTTKALINTLEKSKTQLLRSLLTEVGINKKNITKVVYDLQVSKDISRPDAEILLNNKDSIYIECKVDADLEEEQIKRHLKNKGYLICITPSDKDKNIIKRINDKKLKFITWNAIYLNFQLQIHKIKDEKTQFLVNQFLEYLEAIGMAPFNRWNKSDFEAFLNIEDDSKKELRLRVKVKLNQFLYELKDLLKEENLFEHLEPTVGNIKQNDTAVWGVLCKQPHSKMVHVSHFNFWIDSDKFVMGIQIEGKNAASKMKRIITSNKESVRVSTFFRVFCTEMVFCPRKTPDFLATNAIPGNRVLFLGQALKMIF